MSVAVRRALYGQMSGHGPLTALLAAPATGISKAIYHQVAPSGAGMPYVIFFKSAGTPRYSLGRLSLENEIWTIKGVAEGGAAADLADNIAFQINELFDDGKVSIAGTIPSTAENGFDVEAGQTYRPYLRRESDLEYSEVVDGVLYAHAGALFRLIYQPD